VKFPCKLCKDDHLTHLCPKIEEASRILSYPPSVLTNLFPYNQHMALGTSNTGNASSGSENPSAYEGGHLCVNMVKSQIEVATRSRDYGSSWTIVGSKSPPPPETTLQIEKLEPSPRIAKGVLKRSTNNPNSRASQNY
jgi:hypothetical protein